MPYRPTPEQIIAAINAFYVNIEYDPATPGHLWWYTRMEKALIAAHDTKEDQS